MVHDDDLPHHRRHSEKKSSSSSIGSSTRTTSSDVAASQSCDCNTNNNNPNHNNNNTTSSSDHQKASCKRFKAKHFWRIYGTLIARWCRVVRNNNNCNGGSSVPTATTSSPFSSPPPPPSRGCSSSTSSSSCCSNGGGNKAGFGEELGLAPSRVESQRQIEEEEEEEEEVVENNNTMNGIHSFRYTTTDHHNTPTTAAAATTTAPTGVFKQKTKEKEQIDFLRSITNPLSRIASKRSPSPSPKSSSASKNGSIRRSVSPLTFVHRCITGRKPTAAAATTPPHPADHHHHHHHHHDPSSLAAPSTAAAGEASLSRNASQRSTASTTKLGGGSGSSGGFPAAAAGPSLTRDASVRSTTSNNGAAGTGFSRNPSQRSTTPIMFSNSTGRKVKPPPVQQNLECTLEELFYGCTKKVKVTRDVLTDRGSIVQEEEILSIQVKPGWKRGTKITFEGLGNERLGSEPADVTFVVVEKRHALFRREGDDLEIAIEIPLVQALTGCDISIPLMSNTGETMNLMIQDIIYPGYQKIIPGQGMPRSKEEGVRGNLRVLFLVEFPDELTEEQRAEVVSILDGDDDDEGGSS